LPPTRKTSGVRYEVGSCAISAAIAAKNATTNLRLHRCRRARKTYYLRARVLQAHLAGNQTNNRAEQQNQVADPNPRDDRKNVDLENRFRPVGQDSGIVDVEIFV